MIRSRRAFTLVEIMVVVVIVAILLGLGINAYATQLRRSSAVRNIANVKQAVIAADQLYSSPVYSGSLPITEPAASVTYTGATPSRAAYATLDHVLLATGFLSGPLHWRHPAKEWSLDRLGIAYDPTTRAFIDSGTFDSTITTAAAAPHLETRLSTPATAPSLAAGGNFRLNFSDDLPSNAVVVYAILPNVTARDALTLAEVLIPSDRVPAVGLACDIGPIAYAAADASGNTTVYLYASHR
jgi:prepilin-type N-terminal cleavage/methylation domain-containing protein